MPSKANITTAVKKAAPAIAVVGLLALASAAAAASVPAPAPPELLPSVTAIPKSTDISPTASPPHPPPPPSSTLPTLDWAEPDPASAFTVYGTNGTSAFRFDGGAWCPSASVKRKGTTSLGWPKPKLRIKWKKGGGGGLAVWAPGDPTPARSFDVNSLYRESSGAPTTYVREVAAFGAYAHTGVPAPRARHAALHLNGAFWGLVSLTEAMDAAWLARQPALAGPGALLFKPEDATWANLRPDADASTLRAAWKLEAVLGGDGRSDAREGGGDDAGKAAERGAWDALAGLSRVLADGRVRRGGRRGGAPRLAATIDLPTTLNYLATAAVLLHQDRATKNYFLARAPDGWWALLPGDSKAAMPDGHVDGDAGAPAADYALTTADQFTSPLFGDRAHPGDVAADFLVPWSQIVVSSLDGGDGGPARRRLLAEGTGSVRGDPTAVITASPRACDADASALTPDGPAGTFNWLIDALLACGPVRAMLMRRVERVSADLHGSGWLAGEVGRLASTVRATAAADDAIWRAGDPSAGADRLVRALIPARARQLAQEYGPNGTAAALLPAPQPGRGLGTRLAFQPLPRGAVALCSTTDDAVDLTGLVAVRPGARVAYPPGTVVPPGGGCVVAGPTRADALQAADGMDGGVELAVPVGGVVWEASGGEAAGDDGEWGLVDGRAGGSVWA